MGTSEFEKKSEVEINCPALIFFGRSAQRHFGPQCIKGPVLVTNIPISLGLHYNEFLGTELVCPDKTYYQGTSSMFIEGYRLYIHAQN